MVDLVVTNGVFTNVQTAEAEPANQDSARETDATAKPQPAEVAKAAGGRGPPVEASASQTAETNAAVSINGGGKTVEAVVPVVAPLRNDGAAGGSEKRALLKPGLSVTVRVMVLGKKELDEPNRRVSDEGILVLPLVGTVKVGGMSLAELTADLTVRYKEFFRQPEVVVEYVMEQGADAISPWGYVTVLGRVKRSGHVSIPPTRDLTVSAAIQRAGGLDTSARDSAIRVTRRKDDGATETLQVDLRAIGTRGEKADDLMLRHGDVVFVPEMIF